MYAHMIFPYIGIEISNLYSFIVFLDVLKDWFPPQKLREKKMRASVRSCPFCCPAEKQYIYIYMSWPEEGVTNQTSVLECYIYIYYIYIYIFIMFIPLGNQTWLARKYPRYKWEMFHCHDEHFRRLCTAELSPNLLRRCYLLEYLVVWRYPIRWFYARWFAIPTGYGNNMISVTVVLLRGWILIFQHETVYTNC